MNPLYQHQHQLHLTRRALFGNAARGIGALALASLINPSLLKAATGAAGTSATSSTLEKWPGVINPPHVAPRIKRVIHLCMAGGPSHLETLDHKPKLAEMHGKAMPESFTKGQPIAQLQNQKLTCYGPQHPFSRYGKSGMEMSTLFPHLGAVSEDVCLIRSMKTEAINHDPAHTFMNTGTTISGRPSMGSWAGYGLGAETDALPG